MGRLLKFITQQSVARNTTQDANLPLSFSRRYLHDRAVPFQV